MEPPTLGFPGAGAQDGETGEKESQVGGQVAGLRTVPHHSAWPRPYYSSVEVMMFLPPKYSLWGLSPCFKYPHC